MVSAAWRDSRLRKRSGDMSALFLTGLPAGRTFLSTSYRGGSRVDAKRVLSVTADQLSAFIGARAFLSSPPDVDCLPGGRGNGADWFQKRCKTVSRQRNTNALAPQGENNARPGSITPSASIGGETGSMSCMGGLKTRDAWQRAMAAAQRPSSRRDMALADHLGGLSFNWCLPGRIRVNWTHSYAGLSC